jgi:hypothetical protein
MQLIHGLFVALLVFSADAAFYNRPHLCIDIRYFASECLLRYFVRELALSLHFNDSLRGALLSLQESISASILELSVGNMEFSTGSASSGVFLFFLQAVD